MKLIVGLGNPGKEYENTRHNAGFRFLDSFALSNNLVFNREKFNGSYLQFDYKGEKIILLKPLKYMNLSGEVVAEYMRFYKIDINDLLVIVDDLDTMAGSVKIKSKGSSGGHNGLKNIESHIHSNEYKRIKIGISNDKNTDRINYVIGPVSKMELDKMNKVNKNASEMIFDYLDMTFDNFMNKYNRKK